MPGILLRAGRAVALAVLAPACLLSLAACAQNSTQIPAGTTAALGAQNGADVSNAPQGAILHDALTSDTRNTLQQAMDSAGAGH